MSLWFARVLAFVVFFYGVNLCLCWRWDVWLAVSILGYQTGKTGIRNLNHGRDL